MTQSRRQFMRNSLSLTAAGALLGNASCVPEVQQKNKKTTKTKNVLFITIEDIRDDVLGCYGSPIVKTPNIDRLAKKSVQFNSTYCQYPVCNPSRSSFLTGKRPGTLGILDNKKSLFRENPGILTLPALFKNAGFHTVRLGKIYHGGGRHQDPNGWNETYDFKNDKIATQGTGRNMTNGNVKWCRWLASDAQDIDHSDGKLAAKTVELLKEKRSQNFFIALGFHKPHDPFFAPKKYFDMYPLDQMVPPHIPTGIEKEPDIVFGSSWKNDFDAFTEKERKEFLRSYYACTSFVDAQVGTVLDAMDRLDLWKDTSVVLLGDHGYNLGEHGWWNKAVLYDHSCRVPMMIYAPGETAQGKQCNALVELLDVFPTITDICGLKAPGDLEGMSFRKLLTDPSQDWKIAAYTQVQRGDQEAHSVRTKRWRYTEWDYGKAGAELYDHNNDPDEYYNLVDKPGLENVVQRHKKLLYAKDNKRIYH